MPTFNRIQKGIACICTVAACVATAAVLAQPPIRAFDQPNADTPGWGGVSSGSTLFMRTSEPATMSALDLSGNMVKAAHLPHNVQVVQGIGTKTLLQIDHDVWGRATIELDVPMSPEVWLELRFDDFGRAGVSIVDSNSLGLVAGAPPAQRAVLDCGDCDTPHPTPGCSDPVCEGLVCAQDSFCCVVEWDQFCVNAALAKCDCGNGPGDCGACTPTINDSQVGINGSFAQDCEDGQWVSLAFPILTGGALVDTVVSVHNTNTGEGDIYITGGTCAGPDVNDIYGVCCCGIVNAPSGVAISNTFAGGPFPTSDTDPTWVIMVFRSGFSFDAAFDSTTNPTPAAAFGNLSGLPGPGEWQDLNNYGFGACYWVDLTLTGDPPSACDCGAPPQPPANDDCDNAIAMDVPPGGSACEDGTTILATIDPAECVTSTTSPGVWYKVTGTGNTMTATTCESYPPAGATYDTKISVFCGECPGGVSDCCYSHSTPGCDDAACESIVCAQDSYCCAVMWDSICAGEAQSKCGDLCTGGGGGDLICVDGNDDACAASPLHSTVTWCSQAGAEYLIMVHGYGGATGNFTLCVFDNGIGCPYTIECIPAPPTGGCCQCDDDNVQFCTQETEADCAALDGEFLGLGEPCTAGGDYLVYEAFPNLPIPDGTGQYACDTITVADSLTITDLNVDVVINHTWPGDLCVKLAKAGGPEIVLMKRINLVAECDGTGCCGCSSDNVNALFDDAAPDSVEDACPAIGTYHPDPGSLAAFNGLDAAGDWTLCANDNAGADTGTLIQWSLHFEQPGGDPPCAVAYPDQCNTPPDCSGAYASLDELWPPNHKYRGVTIEGVTDADGDPITITITGIFQDEPVDGLGDGSTCPDGEAAGDVALLRAERSGLGDGRVYHIFFLAEDGEGGECEGAVTVCVPHDQSGDTCVDQGPLHDSTDCGGGGGAPGWGN